ncbi:saccharopine dehydrogenase family protein [Saccharicrinis sp. FJH62]|uniref:saccharopine dehydrogenase family protein n=1 Tax=Saccharicrinis sp. FJH62 TaxID=3344657 RepID=UPI0035D3FAE1
MKQNLMIYGATGFVGQELAAMAVKQGLKPILAGRNKDKLKPLAEKLGLAFRAFDLNDAQFIKDNLSGITVVLNCAGPFKYTWKPLVEACVANGVHYLDITGEIPVFEGIASYHQQAKEKKVMLLPGAGFDVTPTDCLAMYLKEKLPTGTRLDLGFFSDGPAGLPPGTNNTMIEQIPYGNRIRQNGELIKPPKGIKTRLIDFGKGIQKSVRLTWGDVFTAYQSTGIPNIEVYASFPETVIKQLKMIEAIRPLLSLPFVLNLLRKRKTQGSTEAERQQTVMHVWGELSDEKGNKVSAHLHGPEGGVVWTSECALAIVNKILSGKIVPGYQTPAKAYGADLVMECDGISREDL